MRKLKDSKQVHGLILTELLATKKLTNRAAAEIAGVSATSIQDWKTGVAPTDFKGVARLADHLGVSLRYLLTGDSESGREEKTVDLKDLMDEKSQSDPGVYSITMRRPIPTKAIKSLKLIFE